jgi:hypothetical protein
MLSAGLATAALTAFMNNSGSLDYLQDVGVFYE